MKFRSRIWSLPIATAVIVCVGIAINAQISSTTSSALEWVREVQFPKLELLRSMRTQFDSVQSAMQRAVAEGEAAELTNATQNAEAYRKAASDLAALDEVEAAEANELRRQFDAYFDGASNTALILLGQREGDPARAASQLQAQTQTLDKTLGDAQRAALAEFEGLLEQSGGRVKRTLVVVIVSGLVSMIVLAIGSWIVIGGVFRTLGGEPEDAAAIVRRIAAGDFASPVHLNRGDNHSLLHDIAMLRERLGALISNVHKSSREVDEAASELDHGIAELSDRTASQAANLEETASSMEEMTATVRQNADNAQTANKLATAAKARAEAGGEVVRNAVQAMSEINAASRKIADIIGVIDEIAFQTNLLALNAAVEAARAGEQGRGFSVVASEVRNLAQRSATAAREIKQLIEDNMEKVTGGAALVDQSGKNLEEIVLAVQKVAGIIGEISAASMEQTRGIEQVGRAVASMDETTQQNSAMAEHTASVARSMRDQAKQLIDLIATFKTNADVAPFAATATPTTPTVVGTETTFPAAA